MKLKTILVVMGMLLSIHSVMGQEKKNFKKLEAPFFINQWMDKNVSLGEFINYKNNHASLMDFGDRLIILDFWFTHCGDCIAEFPIEDSLQKVYQESIQIIPVTFENRLIVQNFLTQWSIRTGKHFHLPIIVEDTLLRKAFRQRFNPHYVWILPDGKIVGQTSQQFISALTIRGILDEIEKRKKILSIHTDVHP